MRNHEDSRVELLYFSHGYSSSTVMHSHSYCQLEYCLGGCLAASTPEEEILLHPGEFWFLPPGIRHSFHRTRALQDFISIKFRASLCPERQISRDPVCLFYLDEIRMLIDGKGRFSTHSLESRIVMEHALTGLLQRLTETPEEMLTSDFESRLQNTILEFGAATGIDELAENFHMSKAQFKYRFLRELGSGNIKRYIDGVLMKMAQRQLLYSDQPLFRIAEELQFSSLYAFSRYFKHHCGKSPSAFRTESLGDGPGAA